MLVGVGRQRVAADKGGEVGGLVNYRLHESEGERDFMAELPQGRLFLWHLDRTTPSPAQVGVWLHPKKTTEEERRAMPEGAEEWQEIDDEGVELVRLALAER